MHIHLQSRVLQRILRGMLQNCNIIEAADQGNPQKPWQDEELSQDLSA